MDKRQLAGGKIVPISADTVTVYSAGWCPFCRAARQLLDSKSVAYQLIDVDAVPNARDEMQQLGSAHTVPQIFVGETLVGGYTELAGLEQQGSLDPLLESIK